MEPVYSILCFCSKSWSWSQATLCRSLRFRRGGRGNVVLESDKINLVVDEIFCVSLKVWPKVCERCGLDI